MTTILVAKDKILVVMDTCDYKPCNRLKQVAKDNQLQKTLCGMYSHLCSRILFIIVLIRMASYMMAGYKHVNHAFRVNVCF
jgi:hypothetical protein